jgi:hypothetical protein
MAILDDPLRLSCFQGQLVSSTPDPQLQEYARKAGELADAPIALVTFVMGQVQYFRAAAGLPPELELSRATSRCHSYCQFVVSSERPVMIRDILAQPDLPQALAQTYGIRAYLGVPVWCEGQLVGTLCVADGRVRDDWGDAVVEKLLPLSRRVSARLDELAELGALTPSSVKGTDAEARLLAESVFSVSQVLERALAEVGPLVRLASGLGSGQLPLDAFQRGATALKESLELYHDLLAAAREVSEAGERLTLSLSARSTAVV